jgi:hypothetical protein
MCVIFVNRLCKCEEIEDYTPDSFKRFVIKFSLLHLHVPENKINSVIIFPNPAKRGIDLKIFMTLLKSIAF